MLNCKNILILLLLNCSALVYSQADKLNTYSFEQVDSLNRLAPKNVFISFHTDWCKFCALMDQTTFKDTGVIESLNTHFYFISFNPESEEKIKFAGREFKFIPKGNKSGVHEIATELATIDGKLNYPSQCILNKKYEIIFQYNQYLSADDLMKVLNEIVKAK